MVDTEKKSFTLFASYENQPEALKVHSEDEQLLRRMGRDHFTAATNKPEMRIVNPDGDTIATMDIWAFDWIEASA